MAEIILSTTQTIERFVPYTAPTFQALVEQMNNNHEGMSTVITFGQAQDGSWYAVVDRALQVILTMEDVYGMQHSKDIDDGSDTVLKNSKLSMSA